MNEPRERARVALDVAGDVSDVLDAVVDGVAPVIPGLSALHRAIELGRRVVGARRYKTWLAELYDALGGERDQERFAEALEAGDEQTWKLSHSGFRAAMEAVDDRATRCIAAMVADYDRKGQAPDREFRMCGGLLAEADEYVLGTLVALLRLYAEFDAAEVPDHVGPDEAGLPGVDIHHVEYLIREGGEVWFARRRGDPAVFIKTRRLGLPLVHELVSILDRYEFGQRLRKDPPDIPGNVLPNRRCIVEAQFWPMTHDTCLRALAAYLELGGVPPMPG